MVAGLSWRSLQGRATNWPLIRTSAGTAILERLCAFLNGFMFQYVYAEAAVPFGCQNCYKVKVVSDTMRQLMAVKEISESIPCTAKSGAEMNSGLTQHLYGTYFYNWGLDKARELYKAVRARVDAHPKLGPKVRMLIKRGCTNYERKCGPSDKYTFDPKLKDIEDYLAPKFADSPAPSLGRKAYDRMRIFEMMQAAYRIGDDTYKDFNERPKPIPADRDIRSRITDCLELCRSALGRER